MSLPPKYSMKNVGRNSNKIIHVSIRPNLTRRHYPIPANLFDTLEFVEKVTLISIRNNEKKTFEILTLSKVERKIV